MLDKALLMYEISKTEKNMFLDFRKEQDLALELWHTITQDQLFLEKIINFENPPWSLPYWKNHIDETFSIPNAPKKYGIIAVDGSQIYPDKHQGTSCFLINSGIAAIWYGISNESNNKSIKRTYFNSKPYFFTEKQSTQETETLHTVDVVNGKREEIELQTGLDNFKLLKNWHPSIPLILLFDGSLLFWHLESKEKKLKNYFLNRYFNILSQYATEKIPLCSYLSLPKSNDIINLIKAKISNFSSDQYKTREINSLNDTHIIKSFLPEQMRSTIFECRSPLALLYPSNIRPHFIFINTQYELIRLEIPAYIVNNPELLSLCTSTVLDQIHKGNGYPVVLAESHKQAVINGTDRDFFYQLLKTFSIKEKVSILLSQKAVKKRIMTV